MTISRVKGKEQQVYGMTYDYLDRMEKATFIARDPTGSSQIPNSLDNYTVDPTYDVRGNIDALKRYGQYWNGTQYVAAVIDDLDYVLNDNQITSITDNAPASSRRYGYHEGTGNYAYDGNGNVTTDPRSGATFTYNHLDLPTHADFGGGKTIDWLYDGHGNMLQKLVKNGSTIMEQRWYAGEIEYGGDQIEVIYHDAGRIYNTDYVPEFKKIEGTITGTQSVEAVSIASTARIHDAANVDYTAEEFIELESDFEVESGTDFDATILTPLTPDTTWRYDFFIKDHLGNTRVVFNEAEDILAHYEYYPFGLQRNGDWGANTSLNNEKYQYNGIEYVQDHGLNMNMARYRMLDPSIGRWMGVDPRAEHDMAGSPYSSMYDNPLSFNDPEGDCPFCLVAIVIGGGIINTASNWSNINSFAEGLNYFTTGAVGYGVATVNPVLGASIVTGGNLLTKGIYGDLPTINSVSDVLDITASVGIDFLGAYGTGSLVKGYSAFNAGGYLTNAEATALSKYGVLSSQAQAGTGLRAVTTQQVVKATASQTASKVVVRESIWTATKSRTAVQNAFSHFKKHAGEFPEYLNAKQYVQGAKNFLTNSPKGTLTKIRPNGDILKYHPETNTFGVMNSSRIPRTMFRPIDGMKYWLRQ